MSVWTSALKLKISIRANHGGQHKQIMGETDLTIRDFDEALVICVTQRRSIANGLVAAFASGLFCVIAFRNLMRSPILAGTAIFAAGLSFVLATRRRTSELRISKDEIVSKGRVGDNFRSKRRRP